MKSILFILLTVVPTCFSDPIIRISNDLKFDAKYEYRIVSGDFVELVAFGVSTSDCINTEYVYDYAAGLFSWSDIQYKNCKRFVWYPIEHYVNNPPAYGGTVSIVHFAIVTDPTTGLSIETGITPYQEGEVVISKDRTGFIKVVWIK